MNSSWLRETLAMSARRAVFMAVKCGFLPPAKQFACVDCGAPARGWDHRSYFRPFDVQPVCMGCDIRRGPGHPPAPARLRIDGQRGNADFYRKTCTGCGTSIRWANFCARSETVCRCCCHHVRCTSPNRLLISYYSPRAVRSATFLFRSARRQADQGGEMMRADPSVTAVTRAARPRAAIGRNRHVPMHTRTKDAFLRQAGLRMATPTARAVPAKQQPKRYRNAGPLSRQCGATPAPNGTRRDRDD